jgi:nicotinamidase-related amidase
MNKHKAPGGYIMVRLLEKDEALLMVVDVQERLVPAMDQDVFPVTERNIGILIETARIVGLPIFVTEQYSKGLGPTVPEVLTKLEDYGYDTFEKMTFCCLRDKNILKALSDSGKKQVVLCGMEAHVCVYQTGVDLLSAGYEVYLVRDAICSRKKENMETGVRGLIAAGAVEISTETVGFSLLKIAGTPDFKEFSKLIK